jgi:exodeoxyribonuclease-3
VNSIAVRLPQVINWLQENRVDVLCLQETKCVDAKFPLDAFRDAGYFAEVFGQPTYNGVAIVSLWPITDVQRGFADDDFTAQRRLIAATVGAVRVMSVYVPNGSAVGTDKYAFKLDWFRRLRHHLNDDYDPKQPLVICGDYNVAPEERDVHDPAMWEGQVLFSEPERAALRELMDWGLVDTFRLHQQDAGFYSWWDYRASSFRRNQGLRIDHILATAPLAEQCVAAWIDKLPRAGERPSDHAPVVAEFAVSVENQEVKG